MEVLKFTFPLFKYIVPAILTEWTNLLRIKCLNVTFSQYQKQPSEESCKKVLLTFLQNSLKNMKNIRDVVFNLKFQAKRSTFFLRRDSGICAFAEFWRTLIFQSTNRLLLLKCLRIKISCFLVLKFGQILWKIPAKDFTTVVILQSRSLCVRTDNNLYYVFHDKPVLHKKLAINSISSLPVFAFLHCFSQTKPDSICRLFCCFRAICKPRHWNLGIRIGIEIGTDITNVISSSIKSMDPKLRVVT